ncbi:hypothetical protein P8452_71620 [Trifolium repens]|nr:hypothetical protein P8452_71620 [Trifolium repens]
MKKFKSLNLIREKVRLQVQCFVPFASAFCFAKRVGLMRWAGSCKGFEFSQIPNPKGASVRDLERVE